MTRKTRFHLETLAIGAAILTVFIGLVWLSEYNFALFKWVMVIPAFLGISWLLGIFVQIIRL